MMTSTFPALFAANLGQVAQAVRRLRWLMLGAALLALGLAAQLALQLPWLLLVQALATLAVLNFALRHWPLPPRSQLALGLFGDVLVLSEVLAFSGGAANPLASLYLPPVLLAALLLPPRQAWLLALLSLGGYALLFGWHLPWPLAGDDAAYAFRLHLVGMWLTFAVSVLLLTTFVSSLARQLAQREAALAQAREAQLRDEQLVALGVQAAGTAHSLSTPLNTLTLLCDELCASHAADAALQPDLQLMRQQLALCRQALVQLKAGAESRPPPQPIGDALAQQLQGWQATRPGVRLQRDGLLHGGPLMAPDPRFWPALCNLLNNAADAGGGEVELDAAIADGQLQLRIRNRRGRLSAAQLARAGLAPLDSDKPAGLGLGVMLSHVTLSHLGGELRLENDAAGGVCATLRLPLEGDA